MISKEEIEKDIKILKNISECFTYSMWSEDTEALRRVLQYIEQLENKHEKAIKTIENEEIEFELTDSELTNIVLEELKRQLELYRKYVLEIMKGEESE